MTAGFKVLTHDHRPPIQGGEPLFTGDKFPVELGPVKLDRSSQECAAGLNYCRDLATALRIAGLWPDGRAAACFHVEAVGDVVERGDKLRTDRLLIVGRCSPEELVAAIGKLSERFGEHADQMAGSQLAWYDALGRPRRNVREVERGLRRALKARGLGWRLQRFDDARAAWDAWDEWDEWDAWDGWAAWDAWDEWAARDAWAARAAWDAWDEWAARDAWAARAARAALTVEYAALRGWTDHDPLLLTTGIRDACTAGLEVAVPTGPDTLGWAMKAKP